MKKGDRRPINVSEGCFLPITVSASCFLPASLFYSLEKIAKLAKRAGFAGVEAIPFRGAVLSGAPENPAVPITSAHCHFNPIPIRRKAREFGKGAAATDAILFPPNVRCEEFLAQFKGQGISVSTYFVEDLRRKGDVYNSFQLHPDLGMTLEEIVDLLEETGAKATVDLRHIRREKDRRLGGGPSPFPKWRETWETLYSKDLVDNVHVQYLDLEELRKMLEWHWTGRDWGGEIELAEMLRIIGASYYQGPITLEVSPIDIGRIAPEESLKARGLSINVPRVFLPKWQVQYLSWLRAFVKDSLFTHVEIHLP